MNDENIGSKVDRFLRASFKPLLRTEPQCEISEELDQLLWLYAEDELNDEQEQRMWALATEQPGAAEHFRTLLEDLSRHDQPELANLPPGLADKIATQSMAQGQVPWTQAVMQDARQFGQGLTDLVVMVARNFLQTSRQYDQRMAYAVRGEEEETTSLQHELLKGIGVVQIVINHVGNQQCDLELNVIQPSELYAPASLKVALADHLGRLLGESNDFSLGTFSFRGLSTGAYTLTFQQSGQVIEQIGVELQPLDK